MQKKSPHKYLGKKFELHPTLCFMHQYLRWGCATVYFLNERGFSVESSISSNLFLWKRDDSSVVMWTWSWRGKPAASARACLRGKRRAFKLRTWYMFPKLTCREDCDLGLCTFWILVSRELLRTFGLKTCLVTKFVAICLCAAVLFTQVPRKCTDLDLSLLYILILGTYTKFPQQKIFLALGVCFPQTCSSVGSMYAASRSCLHHYWRIVSFAEQQIWWNACKMDSTENPRLR